MSSVFYLKGIVRYEHTYQAVNIVKMNVKDDNNMSVPHSFIYYTYHLNIRTNKYFIYYI
jgi:hypothetical protein